MIYNNEQMMGGFILGMGRSWYKNRIRVSFMAATLKNLNTMVIFALMDF